MSINKGKIITALLFVMCHCFHKILSLPDIYMQQSL